MKSTTFLFICLLILTSCKKEKLEFSAFEIDRSIDCDDLYDNGFRRMFGVDVLLIGRMQKDTLIYFEVSEEFEKFEYTPNIKEEISDYKEIKIKNDAYEEYREDDPLMLSDSIYELAWENLDEQQEYICKNGIIYSRYFLHEIAKNEILTYHKKVDSLKYKVIDIKDYIDDFKTNYSEYLNFKVVNLITKDTFQCSTYKMDEKYYFSSKITIREYE